MNHIGKSLLSITILVVISKSSYGIDWQFGSNKWANNCNLPGEDIEEFVLNDDSRNCGPACDRNLQCTGFVYMEGTCHLKGDPVTEDDAFDADGDINCGFANPREQPTTTEPTTTDSTDEPIPFRGRELNWMVGSNTWANECSFSSEVLLDRFRLRDNTRNCGPACDRNPRCTHFVYDHGWCSLRGDKDITSPSRAFFMSGDFNCGFSNRVCRNKSCIRRNPIRRTDEFESPVVRDVPTKTEYFVNNGCVEKAFLKGDLAIRIKHLLKLVTTKVRSVVVDKHPELIKKNEWVDLKTLKDVVGSDDHPLKWLKVL